MQSEGTPQKLIGGEILDLITVGMYDNPLAIYREYCQNSADAIATFENAGDGKVEIETDPSRLRVTIRDNGPGLSHEAAVNALCPIGLSQKRRGTDRGFRGIGRLSGLAFGESVSFITRSQEHDPVTRITWDRLKLRRAIKRAIKMESVIRECVTIETLSDVKFPAHFFEVQVEGVGRYAAGLILNREAVRRYIGEVCPIPIASTFPFASKIGDLLGKEKEPLALNVIINGDITPVTRRFGEVIQFSKNREDRFTEFEEVDIPSVDGNGSAAVGWVAHSSYLGAIPKSSGIRGIRARAGNIQVGDESVFDALFPEERFNRWCVGELHIVDPRIVPNGRRDYFELGPHVRNLENQLGAVVGKIATRCRKASATRNKKRKFSSMLSQLEETYDLGTSGYLAPQDARALVGQALNRISNIRQNIDSMNSQTRAAHEELDAMEMKLSNFRVRRGRLLGGIPESEITTYQKIFQTIATVSRSPCAAKEMIETILMHA